MANLVCLNAATGDVHWTKDLHTKYNVRMPDWGIAAAPLIEGDSVIVVVSGTDDACVVAFDRSTGEEKWKSLADKASYSSPIVIEQAGKRVMVLWTADRIVGLDPSNGKLHWEYSLPHRQQIDGVITPVISGDRLLVSSVGNGVLMLRLQKETLGVEKAWHRRRMNPQAEEGMHSLIPNPLIMGDHVYGIDYFGELRCLAAGTGDRVWSVNTIIPRGMWAAGHLIQNGDLTWIFTEKGQLIISKLTPEKYEELGRAQLIKPTTGATNPRPVTWAHPAFANRHVFARNDEELVCASLADSGS
jgi:outer membrane protein assembly factor BamB